MAVHDLNASAFPTLDEAQVAELARCSGARLRRLRDGETLFRAGDRNIGFYVVRSGGIEIVDVTGDQARTIVVHGPGQFTGDVTHLTGNPAVVTARARGDTEAYEVRPEALRRILDGCAGLADVLLQAFIARRTLLRESGQFTGLRVIGSRYSPDTFRVRDFLDRNRALFRFIDLEADPDVDVLLRHFGVTEADTPVIACGGKLLLKNPSDGELAERLGLRRAVGRAPYDLVVVGAGPAGLAAAVYGASEGLRTLMVDRAGPGGQAGASMRIENYLGFPTGITGAELAEKAVLQANRFGAVLSVAPASALSFDNAYAVLTLDGGESVTAKCLLIATGAQYRKLGVEGCDRFEGRGVYYAATPNEASLCRGAEVAVVGGGNSAGQAVVYLAGHARKVYLVVRGGDLSRSMSSYLIRRIDGTSNVEVLANTEVGRMAGDGHLSEVEVRNSKTEETRTLHLAALFSFIGATPHTDWLPEGIERDAKGFVRTGADMARSPSWTLKRQPFLLETSQPGVFAAGDVRAGSVKRVASAVGEGAMAVQFVHEHLKAV